MISGDPARGAAETFNLKLEKIGEKNFYFPDFLVKNIMEWESPCRFRCLKNLEDISIETMSLSVCRMD